MPPFNIWKKSGGEYFSMNIFNKTYDFFRRILKCLKKQVLYEKNERHFFGLKVKLSYTTSNAYIGSINKNWLIEKISTYMNFKDQFYVFQQYNVPI